MQLRLPLIARADHVPLQFVRHPKARRYVLRVDDDGSVSVTLPRWGSRTEGTRFAMSQRAWIERQWWRLELERQRASIHPVTPAADRQSLQRARRELPARLAELAAQHQLHVSRVSVRNQKWRWGSCSRSRHICLNWRLVLMPDWIRDYVIIHELMHLRRMDHSPRFWKLVAAACPEYQAARAWLRTFRHA